MVNSSLFRRIELQLLMNLTAHALGQKSQRIWTQTNAEALKAYADYTSSHLQTGACQALLERMNNEAYKMGRLLRCLFLIRHEARAQRLIVALYRNIGIKLSFDSSRQLCFQHCYFSRFYTPQACKAASALDDGIIRGILGLTSEHLHFSLRITEGCKQCRARFLAMPSGKAKQIIDN